MEGGDYVSNSGFGNSMTTLRDRDKKLRRVMTNKRYYEKYRMRQLSYVAQLEAKEKSLRAEVITTRVMLNCAVQQNNLLQKENDSIRQNFYAYSSGITFKEAQYELLLQEFRLLKQLTMSQQSQSEISMNQQPWTEFTPYAQGATVEAVPQEVDLDQNPSQLDIESMMEMQQLCEYNQEPPIDMDMAMKSMIGAEMNEFWVDENKMAGVTQILDKPNLRPELGMEQTASYFCSVFKKHMEDFHKKNENRLPVPASSQSKRPLMPPPLAPPSASFQQWKKFYYGDGSGGTMSSFQQQQPPSDGKSIMIKSSDQGLSNKNLSSTDCDDAKEGVQFHTGLETNQKVDPIKLRRVISNRLSAQKSRIQKAEYVSDMERRIKDLQAQIELYNPEIEILKKRKEVLEIENQLLIEQLQEYNLKRILKEAEIERNKAEVNRLRKLHMSKQQQIMQEKENQQMVQFVGAGMVENPRGMNRSINGLQVRQPTPSVYGRQEMKKHRRRGADDE